ncbi:MAG: serine hydrolase domain-containing protein [Terracidiphilus sp.]
MLHRREFLRSSIGAGLVVLAGDCFAAPATEPILEALKETVGTRANAAGMVGVVIDEGGTRMVSYGSSGVPKLALDGDSVFEMMSMTKVLTSLLLADMVARGEVAFDDPVAKYLPSLGDAA